MFQALTEGALKDAAECAHLDEEEGEAADDAGVGAMAGREDWFARAAAVGRASAAFSADLISARIQRTQQHLLHCASAGAFPIHHWLSHTTRAIEGTLLVRFIVLLLAWQWRVLPPRIGHTNACTASVKQTHGG